MFSKKFDMGVSEITNVNGSHSVMFGFVKKNHDISFFFNNFILVSQKQKTLFNVSFKLVDDFFFFLTKYDPFYCFLLFIVLSLFLNIFKFGDFFKNTNSSKLYVILITNAVSYYETVLFFCCFFFIFLFELFLSFISDEFGDTIIVNVFMFTVLSLLLNFIGVSALKFFSLLSTTSASFSNIRFFLTDVLNHGLCVVRIVMCALRYILYDMQVELIDISLQYTDSLYFDISSISNNFILFFLYKLVFVIFDFFYLTVSILINFFKYGIASFLL